jgi:orotate phosphoribosyltransferase
MMATPTLTISPEQRITELGQDVVAAACLRGRFTHRSGAVRPYSIDAGLLTTRPTLLRQLADALSLVIPANTDRLVAVSPESVPLVTAVSLQIGLSCLFARDRGREQAGPDAFVGEVVIGEHVVAIDAVVGDGQQAICVARALQATGSQVTHILCAVDLEEGAATNVAAAGLQFRSLFTTTELGL